MTETEIALKDAEIAELKALVQKQGEENNTLANKIEEIETASKEAAWQSMKNKLPPGLVHTPEVEAETRKLFENDSYAFTNKLLELRAESPKSEQGAAFVNKDTDPVAEATAILSKRLVMPGTVH